MDNNNIILNLIWNEKNYIVYGNNFTVDLTNGVEVEDLIVTEDNIPIKEFGSTFAGHVLNELDFLDKAITVYVNNETYMKFKFVNKQIKSIRDNLFYTKAFSKEGREISEKIINTNYDILVLDCIFTVNEFTYLAYTGESSEACMLCNASNGALITDYECFYVNGIVDAFDDSDITVSYITDNMKEFLKDYDITI